MFVVMRCEHRSYRGSRIHQSLKFARGFEGGSVDAGKWMSASRIITGAQPAAPGEPQQNRQLGVVIYS
jgi:hypothetical protein